MGKKIQDLIPILSKITRPVAAIKSLRFALLVAEGVTISGKRHPVLPKKPLGSSTFLDILLISLSVYSVY